MRLDYELGVQRLRVALLRKSSQLPPELGLLETRLKRNLYEARIYGDEPTNRSEWAKIMGELIRLADEQLGIDFNDLCRVDERVETPPLFSLKGRTQENEEYIHNASNASLYYGTGKRWGVLAGVNIYKDKSYPRLRVCMNDLVDISQQLKTNGFASNNICLLADDLPERPTRENILTTLKTVAEATQPDDLFLFYYTGHGDIDEREGYLVTHDGRMANLEDTAVSITRIKQIMSRAAARAKVIILDACHGGAAIGAKGPRRMSPDFIRYVFEHAEGIAILSSCKQDQISYEWKEQAQSVFTYYLLEALKGHADNDDKGFVTVADAHRYVTNSVGEWCVRNKKSQSPTLQAEMVGEIIVCYYPRSS